MDKEEIEQLMRKSLKDNFRLFEEQHEVNVYPHEGKISVNYRTSEKTGMEVFVTTHLDLQLIDDICYLIDIYLEKSLRGKGFGWEMYESVHNFSRAFGSKIVRQTPSGHSMHDATRTRRKYLLDRGYVNFEEDGKGVVDLRL